MSRKNWAGEWNGELWPQRRTRTAHWSSPAPNFGSSAVIRVRAFPSARPLGRAFGPSAISPTNCHSLRRSSCQVGRASWATSLFSTTAETRTEEKKREEKRRERKRREEKTSDSGPTLCLHRSVLNKLGGWNGRSWGLSSCQARRASWAPGQKPRFETSEHGN